MVDLESLGKNSTIKAIIDGCLDFFFKPIEDYIFSLCHKFYLAFSVVYAELMVLRTRVQGKMIDITLA